MPTRREVLKNFPGATAGLFFMGCGLADAALGYSQGAAPPKRREIAVGGRRVRVIDVHSHCDAPEVWDLVSTTIGQTPPSRMARRGDC